MKENTFEEIFDNTRIVMELYIKENANTVPEHRKVTSEVGRALISYGAALVGGAHGKLDQEILVPLESFIHELCR